MESRNEPPLARQRLAASVHERLDALGVQHTTRFMPPTDVSNWRLSVATDDGEENLIFGSYGSDTIGVVPAYQEDVSISLATEYVLMSLDLMPEDEWWEMYRVEAAAERKERRAARRARWRARVGMKG